MYLGTFNQSEPLLLPKQSITTVNITGHMINSWKSLGDGVNQSVYALTAYDNELIAGGTFTDAGIRIASWNGSIWQPLSSGMNNYVNSLTVYERELIAGGFFTTAEGLLVNHIARWGLSVNYKGDMNHDSVVNMFDLDLFLEHWLEGDCFATGYCCEADLNYDFVVDLKDYALLADQWLEEP